ncbi:MAG: hypothetical protein ACRENP_28685 [Longimicrobiales bacterium]
MRKLIVTALAVVAGCSRGESAVTARVDFCKQLGEFRAALAAVPPVDPNTEVSTMRHSLERVRREYRDLEKHASRLDEARARNLRHAQENFERAVRDMPGSATLGEAASKMRGPNAELQAASEQMSSAVQCPGGPVGQQ